MTSAEFGDWIKVHVQATGADPVRLTDLLWANFEIVEGKWHATFAELCECSERLIEAGKVPQFPAEHTNAILKELRWMREERERLRKLEQQREMYAKRDPRCDCPACNGGEVKPAWEAAMARLRTMTASIGQKP